MGISCKLKSKLEGLILEALEQGTDTWDLHDLIVECDKIFRELSEVKCNESKDQL